MTAEADNSLAALTRDLDEAQDARYDVIIVGGGIQGVCLLYEASRRGLRALLIEKDDFGGQTSWSSMRVLHGGFRYLQSMDLPRYIESVRARRWFMRMFPGMTEPMHCLMPLYGEGLKRPEAFRAAVWMNRQLIRFEGRQLGEPKLNPGAVLSPSDVVQDWQRVPTVGLKGGGMWTDARMLSPERMVIHLLRVAVGRGAHALNYVCAEDIQTSGGNVTGLIALDTLTDRELRFDAPIVINAAGPWSMPLSRSLGDARPELFIPMRSFNVIVDREPQSESAIAVTARKPGAQTYFVVPFGDKVILGTAHMPASRDDFNPNPSRDEVQGFLDEVNEAAPGLEADIDSISCVWSGLVPAPFEGATYASDRPVVHEHGHHGGPNGLISVSGVKFTTAPMLARRVIDPIPGRPMAPFPDVPNWRGIQEVPGYGGSVDRLIELARDESVQHVDDLVFRRTGLWQNAAEAMDLFPRLAGALSLSGAELEDERVRLKRALLRISRPWEVDGAGN
ncbi:MAG: FAD-dependent oxidoreductase [Phycisphaerales bacterium]|nr:FAD-dependent oxidoreductase [Phycisphaerales bacterium]MCB9836414.1 FAD-dependent oxidoreductase [Phycisphaera sp.]